MQEQDTEGEKRGIDTGNYSDASLTLLTKKRLVEGAHKGRSLLLVLALHKNRVEGKERAGKERD